MANFFSDNDDLQFYFDKVVPWPRIIELIDARDNWQEVLDSYRDILNLFGQFAGEEVAPRAPAMDRKGAHLENGVVKVSAEHTEIFEQLKAMGVYGVCCPKELGGMGVSGVLYLMVIEMIARADVATMTHFGFHVATIVTLLQYSLHEGSTQFGDDGRITSTRFDKEIQEIIRGDAWGSMDLTEPNAGSDLAALKTRAVQDEQGVWRITGNKIFITSGHGKYHLVLAKTDDRQSLDALSLFLVPLQIERDGKTLRNGTIDRVEEKLGHHGSPTVSVQFDHSEGALLGKVGEGFKLMLKLMNHARLGVGLCSIGVCEAAYRAAKAYAAERVSMGQTIDQHPMIASYLEEMDITLRGMRAIGIEAAIAEEQAIHLEIRQRIRPNTDEARELRRLRRRVRYLTPLLKYITAEQAVQMSRMAMQIHGGNGYTPDYAPERLLRDALVMPIYEGTSQIQALMVLKDHLGLITKNPQRFVKKVAATKLRALKATDALERSALKMQSLAYSAEQHIMWRVFKDKWGVARHGPITEIVDRLKGNWDPKRDFAHGQLHAENLTRILCDAAIAEVLVEQGKTFPERRELAERWIERAEPRVRYHCDLIHATGDRLLAQLEARAAENDDQRSA